MIKFLFFKKESYLFWICLLGLSVPRIATAALPSVQIRADAGIKYSLTSRYNSLLNSYAYFNNDDSSMYNSGSSTISDSTNSTFLTNWYSTSSRTDAAVNSAGTIHSSTYSKASVSSRRSQYGYRLNASVQSAGKRSYEEYNGVLQTRHFQFYPYAKASIQLEDYLNFVFPAVVSGGAVTVKGSLTFNLNNNYDAWLRTEDCCLPDWIASGHFRLFRDSVAGGKRYDSFLDFGVWNNTHPDSGGKYPPLLSSNRFDFEQTLTLPTYGDNVANAWLEGSVDLLLDNLRDQGNLPYEDFGEISLDLAFFNSAGDLLPIRGATVYMDPSSAPAIVPLPPSFWLFGYSLLGLIGINHWKD